MRTAVMLLGVCVLVAGCGSGVSQERPDVTGIVAAGPRVDGPLWFLGGDNPGSVFGRSGPLYHIDTGTGALTRVALPKRLWSVTGLAVSPDGRQIALSNGGGEFPPRNLYVMRTDGSALRQVTSGNYYEVTPAWSPDGSWIVFASTRCCATAHYSGDYALYLIHPNGSGLRMLHRDPHAIDTGPTWSPDARHIAYIHNSGDGWQVWIVNIDGSHAHPLTHDGRFDDAVAWSPSGHELAYISHLSNDADWQVRVVQANGHDPHPIFTCTTRCAYGGYTLAWSPDGKQIAFTIYRDRRLNQHVQPRIALINATGGGYHLLTTKGTGACCLSWISKPGK